jgi:hypothetical protein
LSRRFIDAILVPSGEWYATHYDCILANALTLAWIKNPGREKAKANVFITLCGGNAIFDLYAIYAIFCRLLSGFRIFTTAPTFRNQESAEAATFDCVGINHRWHGDTRY